MRSFPHAIKDFLILRRPQGGRLEGRTAVDTACVSISFTRSEEESPQTKDSASLRSRFAWRAKPALPTVELYWFAIFAGLALICAVSLTVDNVLSVGFLFERNYNEGWNVYNAQIILDRELIYDDNYW